LKTTHILVIAVILNSNTGTGTLRLASPFQNVTHGRFLMLACAMLTTPIPVKFAMPPSSTIGLGDIANIIPSASHGRLRMQLVIVSTIQTIPVKNVPLLSTMTGHLLHA
jgi:hypothetical protein